MLSIPNMIGELGDMESSVVRVSTSEKSYVKYSSKYKYGKGSVAFMQSDATAELTYVLRDASGVLSLSLNNTHKYYFSIWIMQRTSLDITFDAYWPIVEPPVMRGIKNSALNTWEQKSTVFDRAGFSNGSHPFRIDCNNYPGGNALMNVDGLVLVDLTAAFGAGYEPTKDWCDAHIPFGTGNLSVPEPIPKVPRNLRKMSITGSIVTLDWESSKFATGYNVYKDGDLVRTTTETSCTVSVVPFIATEFTVAAYNDSGVGEKTSSLVVNTCYYVTNRTQQDVDYVKQLTKKLVDDTATDEEKIEWNSFMLKGVYNYTDLNRVGAAMNYVADKLRKAGYDPHISPKTDWVETDWPTQQSMSQYLDDLKELSVPFAQVQTTPPVPTSMEGLTWQEANDIEHILHDIDMVLSAMLRVRLRSAQVLCFSGFSVYPREPLPLRLLTADGKAVITEDGMDVYLA